MTIAANRKAAARRTATEAAPGASCFSNHPTKGSGTVLEHQIADKQVLTARVEGGTEEQAVPLELRRAPVLDDEAVQQKLDEAGNNPIKQIAAKRGAEELKKQAVKQSDNLVREAEIKAAEMIEKARAEAEKI